MRKTLNNASLALLTLLPASALAASTYTAPPVEIKDPSVTTVSDIINAILGWVIPLLGGIAVLFIIYAGVQYVTAAGNKERIEGAKQTLTYAIIGLIVIVLAGVIVSLVTNLPTNVGLTKP